MLRHLPNVLTLTRLAISPLVAWALFEACRKGLPTGFTGSGPLGLSWTLLATLTFSLAALTDLADGMAARILGAHSRFGRLMDPIADKALVGLPLVAISAGAWMSLGPAPLFWVVASSTLAIVTRDVVMTLTRLRAGDGEGVRVSQLAKVKTALELIAIGAPPGLASLVPTHAVGAPDSVFLPWLILLPIAAALSLWTAWSYLTRGAPNANGPRPGEQARP